MSRLCVFGYLIATSVSHPVTFICSARWKDHIVFSGASWKHNKHTHTQFTKITPSVCLQRNLLYDLFLAISWEPKHRLRQDGNAVKCVKKKKSHTHNSLDDTLNGLKSIWSHTPNITYEKHFCPTYCTQSESSWREKSGRNVMIDWVNLWESEPGHVICSHGRTETRPFLEAAVRIDHK